MGAILIGVILIAGGFSWAALVVMACGMSSRPVTNADSAPALLGVAAMGLGIIIIVAEIISRFAG